MWQLDSPFSEYILADVSIRTLQLLYVIPLCIKGWVAGTGFVLCAAPALYHAPVREVRSPVRNDSDVDVIYYLKRTRLPVNR